MSLKMKMSIFFFIGQKYRAFCAGAGQQPDKSGQTLMPQRNALDLMHITVPDDVNMLTQQPSPSKGHGHPGEATLQSVTHTLRELKKVIQKEGYTSVAIPKLATGVGGLVWEDVQPIINKVLGDLNVPVYVYTTYVQGKAAEE
jgi:O-acetyl-ADP-ribose deacetylase (regulator of RNase III)